MDSLDSIMVFARVVELRSFSEAARQLGISRSAVSKHVSRLETRLGARLLRRTTRRISLTDMGMAFYERSARLVREAEEAERALRQAQSHLAGTLRVSLPVTFGRLCVAPLLAPFLRRHPDLQLELCHSDRLVDVIGEGFDLAIRVGGDADGSLGIERVAPSRVLVCGTPEYFRRVGAPETPDELVHHACLTFTGACPDGRWRFLAPDGQTFSMRPKGPLTSDDGVSVRDALLAGMGVSLLPTYLAGPALAEGRLRAVLLEHVDQNRPVCAVYAHGRQPAAKVRAFVDHLIESFGPSPDWEPADLKAVAWRAADAR